MRSWLRIAFETWDWGRGLGFSRDDLETRLTRILWVFLYRPAILVLLLFRKPAVRYQQRVFAVLVVSAIVRGPAVDTLLLFPAFVLFFGKEIQMLLKKSEN